MRSTEFSLEDLLAPVTAQEFYDRYWEKDNLYIARGDTSYYRALFSFADVDRLIFLARERSEELLSIVPPPGSGREQRHYRAADVSMEKLYSSFHAGDTIRLVSVQDYWVDLHNLSSRFSEALGVRININLYMTPQSSQAFPVHFDTHDGFIMQVDGSKEWYVYEPYYELPMERLSYVKNAAKTATTRSRREDELQLKQQVCLETGDLLYIPRGFPHKAIATDKPSLHLTVGLHPLCWVDFLKAALEVASADNVGLRRSLGPGFAKDPKIRQEMPETFHRLLAEVCNEVSFEKTLETLTRAQVNGRDYPPDGYFAEVARLSDLTGDSVVERRSGIDCSFELSGEEHAVIHFAGNHVRGPRAMARALEYIRDHKVFRVSDLPGLEPQSRLTLVRRLIREGLLRTSGAVFAPDLSAEVVA